MIHNVLFSSYCSIVHNKFCNALEKDINIKKNHITKDFEKLCLNTFETSVLNASVNQIYVISWEMFDDIVSIIRQKFYRNFKITKFFVNKIYIS